MWAIEWSAEARQEIRRLPNEMAARIIKKLGVAASDPPRFFERLVGCDYCRLRVGDYRVVALLLQETKTVSIQKIGHRKSVYK